ncbi:MAG: peptide chain release factor 2 [Planctomycetota bacterium]
MEGETCPWPTRSRPSSTGFAPACARPRRLFDLPRLRQRLRSLERKMSAGGFWSDGEAARRTVAELKGLKGVVEPWDRLDGDLAELAELIPLAEGPADERELRRSLEGYEAALEQLEFQLMMSGPHDPASAYVAVNPGAGGIDSCDWAEMLLRMYLRWAERSGLQTEILELQPNDEGGIKSATFAVRGDYAYGNLRAEAGVHRLVRISPFDAQKRRHTSFASVDVVPEIEDDAEIEIRDADLRVETYRAGGAGGQHVNKTDSAVRITHEPTGVVAACQNERSQHRNRQLALRILKAKLYRLQERQREEELRRSYGDKADVAFGSQIRNYVLHPYQLVKDVRTEVETSQVEDVLDGDLDRFIQAYLKSQPQVHRQDA